MAPNLNSEDYYEILGCPRSADESALKKAYRKLAVKWHPDKNPDDEQATKNFQKISEAYATLSDPQKRKLYDQYGVDGVNAADQMGENGASAGGSPGGGMPFHFGGPRSRHGGSGAHMSSDEAEAFFSQFFGHDDPFGGLGGRRGGGFPGGGSPFVQMGGSRVDPISMMFGGMPGGMSGGMPGGMRGMPQQRRAPAAPMYNAIPEGTTVSLKGLVSQPERNGDRGVIRQYNAQKDRYYVALEDSEETMLVKPSNLLQHVSVRLNGIESKPELNGKSGTIIAWNAHNERYSVYVMAISKGISLKPNNVVLDNGTVGQITGLQSKPQLNGKWGTIKEWLREAGRYSVQLSASQIINIKLENIVV